MNHFITEREDAFRTIAEQWWSSLTPALERAKPGPLGLFQRIAFRKGILREVHLRRHA